jgi:RNA polymerase sigma-70 factor (ECF subfamily)
MTTQGGDLDPRTETELIARLRKQDLEALGEVFRAYGGAMTTLACSLLRDPDRADDAVENALLRIHAAAPKFRGEASLRSWVLQITANLCRDELRRRRFDGGRPEDLDPLATRGLSVNPTASWDEALDREKILAQLEAALDRLTDEQREAILLRDRLGLSYEEAATAAGVTADVIKARLFRAREKLRQILGGSEPKKEERR